MCLGKPLVGSIVAATGSALLLAGCALPEPVAGYPASPYDYYGAYAPPGYYAPDYYAPGNPYWPGFYGPSLGFGFGGGFHDHDERGRHDRDHEGGHDRDSGHHAGAAPGRAAMPPRAPAGPAGAGGGGRGGQHPEGRAHAGAPPGDGHGHGHD